MTEAEWLTCDNPVAALVAVELSRRKVRLCALAFCRSMSRFVPTELMSRVIEVAEQLADEEISFGLAARIRDDLLQETRSWGGALTSTVEIVTLPLGDDDLIVTWLGGDVIANAAVSRILGSSYPDPREAAPHLEQEHKTMVGMVQELFVNPFRPVAFDPEWRTSTAVTLARQMYESRDFDAMPILADALQDAGCDNADILSHCRDASATHVRGCWVVDLVLDKS